MRIKRSFVAFLLVSLLGACGGGGGGGSGSGGGGSGPPPGGGSSNWDELVWDQDSWS